MYYLRDDVFDEGRMWHDEDRERRLQAAYRSGYLYGCGCKDYAPPFDMDEIRAFGAGVMDAEHEYRKEIEAKLKKPYRKEDYY